MKKIAAGSIVLLAAIGLLWAGAAGAADFPKKRITYNICFNPGGESDITARIQEQALKKHLGADVAIQYKIGGGGALCWSELVQSAPDGYTIAGHNLPHTILQPMEMGDAGYKTLDLKQIYMFESTPNVLMVRKDSPFQTLKDFVEYAKKNPPGVVTVGGSGTSSANDLGTTMLGKAAGIKLTYVPFGGTGSAVPALLGSHVTALMSYSPMVVQYRDKFRFLAIASEKRMDVQAGRYRSGLFPRRARAFHSVRSVVDPGGGGKGPVPSHLSLCHRFSHTVLRYRTCRSNPGVSGERISRSTGRTAKG